MHLKIITPNEILFSGKVEVVEVPTLSGTIGILPDHAPLSTIVASGKVKFISKIKEDRILDAAAFLFEDEYTILEVDEGMVYLNGKDVIMFVRSWLWEKKPEGMNLAFEQAHIEIKKLASSLQTRRIKNINMNKKGF